MGGGLLLRQVACNIFSWATVFTLKNMFGLGLEFFLFIIKLKRLWRVIMVVRDRKYALEKCLRGKVPKRGILFIVDRKM